MKKTVKTSEFELKDSRRIFRTHNGFKYWVVNKNSPAQEVTEEYYFKAKKNKI
jgi:hypothetical protein